MSFYACNHNFRIPLRIMVSYDFRHVPTAVRPLNFESMKTMVDLDTLLCWGATYKKVRAGEIIFLEGSQGRYYHQLVEGRVLWMNVDDSGREFIQKVIEEGESFGELPLLDDGPYVATAVADKDSLLLRLPKEVFLQLLHENSVIHFAFTR